jgi:MHS family shikimate/dehydroshikimate transporter-like MFS transporter
MEQKTRPSMGTVVTASVVGTAIEWYDYVIYGTAAALVFNKLFFPSMAPLVGVIAAFGAFAMGAVARPLGGVIFGHFGDRVGRKSMLMITMFVMGGATFLIGLLPTYNDIGIWAPIALVALRIIQGLGLGGEWGGASVMVLEYSPKHRRGFYGSLVQNGYPIGVVISIVAFTLVSRLPEEQLLSWGWRLPFLFSIVLVFVGIYIRLKLEESPVFELAKARNDIAKLPVLETILKQPKTFLILVGLKMGESTTIFIVTLFSIVYATSKLGLTKSQMLDGILIAATLALFSYPAFGALSDRIGRRPFYIAGPIFIILFAFPLFWMLDTKDPFMIVLSIVIGLNFGQGMMFALQSTYFPELFSTRIRYSGSSLGFQVAAAIAGGISPVIATSLLNWTGTTTGVSLYMIVMALISLCAALAVRETLNTSLTDTSQYDSEAPIDAGNLPIIA